MPPHPLFYDDDDQIFQSPISWSSQLERPRLGTYPTPWLVPDLNAHLTTAKLTPIALKGGGYFDVHALFLFWEADDLNVEQQVSEVQDVLMTDFKTSSATVVKIPSQHPFRYMEKVFENFKNKCAAVDNLLVVYYHGHGSLENNKLMWAANR